MGLWGGLWGGPIASILPYGSLGRSVGWPYSLYPPYRSLGWSVPWPYSVYPALWVFQGIYGAVLYTMAHPMGLWSGLWGGPILSILPYGSSGASMGRSCMLWPTLWVFGAVCGVAL